MCGGGGRGLPPPAPPARARQSGGSAGPGPEDCAGGEWPWDCPALRESGGLRDADTGNGCCGGLLFRPVVFFAVLQWGRWPPGPAWLLPPVERMAWGWCHRARGLPPEPLMRGPATAWPGAMPSRPLAAGRHHVDAPRADLATRCCARRGGRHGQPAPGATGSAVGPHGRGGRHAQHAQPSDGASDASPLKAMTPRRSSWTRTGRPPGVPRPGGSRCSAMTTAASSARSSSYVRAATGGDMP